MYTFGGLNCPIWEGYCRNDPLVTLVRRWPKMTIEEVPSLVYFNPETQKHRTLVGYSLVTMVTKRNQPAGMLIRFP
jgi:hypothetical protein